MNEYLKNLLKPCYNFYIKILYRPLFRAYFKKKFTPHQEAYGMHEAIMNYVGEEYNFLNVRLQHGWTPYLGAIQNDIDSRRDVMLCWHKRYRDDWQKRSKYPCHIIMSPFVMYRRQNNIEPSADAQGTIFYMAHGTNEYGVNNDLHQVCEQIKALPEQFHPITISLFYLDIERYGVDEIYKSYGFNTVCLTDFKGVPYYKAFYDVLRKHRYAAGNEPGSFSFYAIEMGIPFFCMGEPATRANFINPKDATLPDVFSICDFEYGKKAYDLFAQQPYGVITDEQRAFVESELGIHDGITKEELKELLRKASQ